MVGLPDEIDHSNNRLVWYSDPKDVDITDREIQVGGAREGQSFVLKV
jgi:hypothetical protein